MRVVDDANPCDTVLLGPKRAGRNRFLADAAHGGKQHWSEYGRWKQKTGGFSQPKQPHRTYSRHPERFWVAGGRGKGKKVERVRVMIQTRRRPKPALGREREVQIHDGPIPMLVFSYHLDRKKKPWQYFSPARARVLRVTLTCTYSLPCSLVMRSRIGEQRNALVPTIYARIA